MDVKTTFEGSPDSDRALATRVRQDGDEQAFRALYRRHTPALYPFVLRLLGGSEHDADDVVQDTWLKAVSALPRFRWESSFRTWLVGIGLNQARDALRKRARSGGTAEAPEPGVAPMRSEDRVDLERAIATLPDGYRTVLILHDVEGFTHPEIGARLEIAVGTSRSQLFHARRALRDLLEPPAELKETS